MNQYIYLHSHLSVQQNLCYLLIPVMGADHRTKCATQKTHTFNKLSDIRV